MLYPCDSPCIFYILCCFNVISYRGTQIIIRKVDWPWNKNKGSVVFNSPFNGVMDLTIQYRSQVALGRCFLVNPCPLGLLIIIAFFSANQYKSTFSKYLCLYIQITLTHTYHESFFFLTNRYYYRDLKLGKIISDYCSIQTNAS